MRDNNGKTPITIIIADDHPIFREGLRLILEANESFSIVAEAGDGKTALDLIENHQPDIVMLDIDMPEMNGFSVVRALQKKQINSKIIFLTMHNEEELFNEAMDLKVNGYVLKDSLGKDIVDCLKTIAQDKSYLSPSLSSFLLSRYRSTEIVENIHGLHLLTNTERSVLKLIAEEKTSKEIGKTLFISYRTVETHRANIIRKLGLHGSLALVKFAIANKSDL